MKCKVIMGIVLTLLLVSLLNIWVQSIAAQPSGMISYWRFDEGSETTAYDSVGDNACMYNGD